MEAYFYANHKTQAFDSSTPSGFRLVGELDLPAGNYVVVAKADIGVNVAGGYPLPPWPDGGGALALSLGGAGDTAYAAVKPESGENCENLCVMLAAQIDSPRQARLFFINPYPLPVYVNEVRLTAMQFDNVNIVEIGSESISLPNEKSLFVKFAMETGILSAFGGRLRG